METQQEVSGSRAHFSSANSNQPSSTGLCFGTFWSVFNGIICHTLWLALRLTEQQTIQDICARAFSQQNPIFYVLALISSSV